MSGWSRGSLKYRPVTLMIVIVLVALTGFLFVKTSSELAPEEDRGAVRAGHGAALRDQRLHPDLHRPDRQADQGPARAQGHASRWSGLGGADQFGLRGVGAEGLVGADALAEADPAGDPGPPVARRRRPGLRLRAAVAAGRRRRPADLDGDPEHRRSEQRLRGRRAGEAEGAGLRQVHHRPELACLRRAGR